MAWKLLSTVNKEDVVGLKYILSKSISLAKLRISESVAKDDDKPVLNTSSNFSFKSNCKSA